MLWKKALKHYFLPKLKLFQVFHIRNMCFVCALLGRFRWAGFDGKCDVSYFFTPSLRPFWAGATLS